MDLHELRPPDLPRLAARGEAARLHRGPRTIGEVLRAASAAMDEEDAAEEMARAPLLWLRAHRPRRLIDRLLGR